MDTTVVLRAFIEVTRDRVASPEARLVAQAQRGDHQAFETLVRRHLPRLVKLARRLAPAEAAEDIAQDAIIRAYEQIGRFRGDAKFATWLYAITVNEARMHLRRQRRRASALERYPRDDDTVAPPSLTEPGGPLVALIHELPDRQKVAVALFYVQGNSVEEIAQAMNAPTGTVKSWIARGRDRLRDTATKRGLL
jgi:RNA polymerase sigma-70 factor, ECF subfamily